MIFCQKNDPSIRNVPTNDVGVTVPVETNYSDASYMLWCSLEIKAKKLPKNQPLRFTCLNVDIGISATDQIEVAGNT